MAATLSKSDYRESGGDEVNEDENFLAFMANQEDIRSVSSDDSSDVYKEHQKAYDKMYESWVKAIRKINVNPTNTSKGKIVFSFLCVKLTTMHMP